MRELNMVGSKAARQIQLSMVHLYKDERNREIRILTKSAQEIGIKPHFAMLDTRAIELTLNDTTPVFSKISYRNLGRNKRVR